MHELSVAHSMIELVVENARASNAEKVIKVSIVVGNLAGIVVDSLAYCFDVVKKDTIADSAELTIEEISAKAFCHDCNVELEVGQYDFECPKCNGIIIPSGGRELYLKDMEVE